MGVDQRKSQHQQRTDWVGLSAMALLILIPSLLWSIQSNQYPIALTDQKAGDARILLLNYAESDWSERNPAAVLWSWKPSDSGLSPADWGLPTEARLRRSAAWGGEWMAVCDSYGLMAVVSYPDKVPEWSISAGRLANVHSIELLPNGNVAAAASTGGWVRVYTASQGPSSSAFAQYNLPDAHSVLWDPRLNVLWALGRNKLVQLKIGGSDAAPTLILAATTTLSADGGHDVEPKYGDPTKLWITAGASTWIYDKATGKETRYQQTVGYKSINNQSASGQIVETRPHASCTQNSWCTDILEFYSPTDLRTRPHAAIYRARIWDPDYQ